MTAMSLPTRSAMLVRRMDDLVALVNQANADTSRIVGNLTGMVAAQADEIDALQAKVAAQTDEIATLQARIAAHRSLGPLVVAVVDAATRFVNRDTPQNWMRLCGAIDNLNRGK